MVSARRSLSFGVVCSSGPLLLAALCVASRARAATPGEEARTAELAPSEHEHPNTIETRPMQPGRGMVRVHVNAQGRRFFVYLGRSEYPVAACRGECDFWAWPEKYRAVIRDGDGPNDDAVVALRLRRPGNYAFVPAQGNAQNAGLVLGITGPVIGFAGLIFTAAGLLETCSAPPPGQSCGTPSALYIGLPLLALGAGMTTAGWWLYARSRAHFQLTDAPPPATGPRLGALSLPHRGLGIGLTLAF